MQSSTPQNNAGKPKVRSTSLLSSALAKLSFFLHKSKRQANNEAEGWEKQLLRFDWQARLEGICFVGSKLTDKEQMWEF